MQVSSKAMAVGRLFSLQYDASSAFLLATAGSKGHVALWHSDEDEAISARCSTAACAVACVVPCRSVLAAFCSCVLCVFVTLCCVLCVLTFASLRCVVFLRVFCVLCRAVSCCVVCVRLGWVGWGRVVLRCAASRGLCADDCVARGRG